MKIGDYVYTSSKEFGTIITISGELPDHLKCMQNDNEIYCLVKHPNDSKCWYLETELQIAIHNI